MSPKHLAGLAGGMAAAILLTATLEGQRGQPPSALAITGATVIDGTGAAPAANRTIVIVGQNIAAIGAAGAVQVPANARTIDAAGKFVIPGLIDGHVHWRGWTGELFLSHGVTSVVDLGSPTDWVLAARGAEEGGAIRGPRIFTAAGAIGHRPAREQLDSGATTDRSYMFYIDGAASARSAVRALLVKGPDVVSVAGDLTADEYRAITDEAHKVDVGVVGDSNDIYAAVEAGVDGVTELRAVSTTLMTPENRGAFREGKVASPHARIDPDKMDALVSFMVKRRTSLGTSLVSEHGGALPQARQFEMADYELLMRPELRYVPLTATLTSLTFWRTLRSYSAAAGSFPFVESSPPQIVEEFRRGYRHAQEFIRRFAKAGGRVVASTDAGGSAAVPGSSLHHELELLVDSGLTPMQALVSATRTPAEVIKKDYKVGTLAAGKLADLVILDADPLADIRNARRINSVVKNGQVVEVGYRRTYYTAFSEIEGIGSSRSTQPVPIVTEVISKTLNQSSQVIHDGSPFQIVVRGDGFHSSSLVELNGRPLETTFVSRNELQAGITTELVPVEGTYAVTVFTPWPGGGRSNVKGLSVK